MALIIKSLGVDTPNYDELSDDEDDFVKDPSQYRAVLPQPYRFIDEVLSLFIDDVWEEITFKENEKEAEMSKIRPPKYECAVQMHDFNSVKALAASHDGRYLFVASTGSLSVLDASKRKLLHTHEDEHLDLHTLICCIIGVEVYLLVGIDEQGVCHVFACAGQKLLAMKVLNEDAAVKLHVTKCQPSLDGDYLGLVLENPASSDVMLQVYSFPKDVWLKEIEDAKSKFVQNEESKQEEISQPALPDKEAEELEASPAAVDGDEVILSGRKSADSLARRKGGRLGPHSSKSADACYAMGRSLPSKVLDKKSKGVVSPSKSLRGSSKSRTQITASRKSTSKVKRSMNRRRKYRKVGSKKGFTYKFTMASLIMRQHRPDKLQTNPGISPSAALKELSDPKVILGSGHGHLLTRPYMDIRQEAFDEMHRDKVMYKLSEDSEENKQIECNFHFFTPGVAIPYGIEQPGAFKKPSSIGVWWSGSCQFIYYSLTRPVKVKKTAADAQDAVSRRGKVRLVLPSQAIPSSEQPALRQPELDIKAETVWPQAAVITASATSPESALVAIGLQNGLVTIWDKLLCCVRKSVLISRCAITKLDFMEPSICPQSNNKQQSYPTSTSCYVLVRCMDSSLHILNCGPMDFSPPITIAGPSIDDDRVITTVDIFPSKCPEVIMKVFKNGTMFLQDVISTKTLCEISLPPTHELTTPWQPLLSVSAYGQMLYIKGSQKQEEETECNIPTSLFAFQFRSFPALDSYWSKFHSSLSYLTTSPIDTRINALLKQRVKSSGARQQRLQRRWPLMKQEALKIAQIRSH